jgi:hypothetical protein
MTFADILEFVETPVAVNIALGFTIAAVFVSFFNVYMHLSNYARPKLQRYIVRDCSCFRATATRAGDHCERCCVHRRAFAWLCPSMPSHRGCR